MRGTSVMRGWRAGPGKDRDGADIPAERTSALEKAYGKAYRDVRSRPDDAETPAVMCWYPTPALARMPE